MAFLVLLLQAIMAFLPSNATASDPAIMGYSPVSYFTKGIAELGSPDHQHEHKGSTYYFTSAEQITLFKSQPDKYVPHFGAYCPYSLALGKIKPIDPTNFKIVGDNLLLFHRTRETDALQSWNSMKDEQAMMRKAEGQYELLRF